MVIGPYKKRSTEPCSPSKRPLARHLPGARSAQDVGSAIPASRESKRIAWRYTVSQGIPLEEETSMASRRRLLQRFAFASHAVHQHRRRPVLEVLEGRVVLSTFTVNSLGDAGSGSNDSGDLRYCINQANADDQANTIVFDPTVFSTPQTITLSGGQLELSDTGGTQTITGPAAGVTISGGGNSRVFQVDSGVTASISGLTISGGNGGGLANYGTATLTDCTLSGNIASNGGGVINSGTATLIGCTVSGNTAYYHSYSGYSYGEGRTYTTGGSGGGVDNSGTATLTGCTISGNARHALPAAACLIP